MRFIGKDKVAAPPLSSVTFPDSKTLHAAYADLLDALHLLTGRKGLVHTTLSIDRDVLYHDGACWILSLGDVTTFKEDEHEEVLRRQIRDITEFFSKQLDALMVSESMTRDPQKPWLVYSDPRYRLVLDVEDALNYVMARDFDKTVRERACQLMWLIDETRSRLEPAMSTEWCHLVFDLKDPTARLAPPRRLAGDESMVPIIRSLSNRIFRHKSVRDEYKAHVSEDLSLQAHEQAIEGWKASRGVDTMTSEGSSESELDIETTYRKYLAGEQAFLVVSSKEVHGMSTLERAQRARWGFRVSQLFSWPVIEAQYGHTQLRRFLGHDKVPAPTLGDAVFEDGAQMLTAYADLLNALRLLIGKEGLMCRGFDVRRHVVYHEGACWLLKLGDYEPFEDADPHVQKELERQLTAVAEFFRLEDARLQTKGLAVRGDSCNSLVMNVEDTIRFVVDPHFRNRRCEWVVKLAEQVAAREQRAMSREWSHRCAAVNTQLFDKMLAMSFVPKVDEQLSFTGNADDDKIVRRWIADGRIDGLLYRIHADADNSVWYAPRINRKKNVVEHLVAKIFRAQDGSVAARTAVVERARAAHATYTSVQPVLRGPKAIAISDNVILFEMASADCRPPPTLGAVSLDPVRLVVAYASALLSFKRLVLDTRHVHGYIDVNRNVLYVSGRCELVGLSKIKSYETPLDDLTLVRRDVEHLTRFFMQKEFVREPLPGEKGKREPLRDENGKSLILDTEDALSFVVGGKLPGKTSVWLIRVMKALQESDRPYLRALWVLSKLTKTRINVLKAPLPTHKYHNDRLPNTMRELVDQRMLAIVRKNAIYVDPTEAELLALGTTCALFRRDGLRDVIKVALSDLRGFKSRAETSDIVHDWHQSRFMLCVGVKGVPRVIKYDDSLAELQFLGSKHGTPAPTLASLLDVMHSHDRVALLAEVLFKSASLPSELVVDRRDNIVFHEQSCWFVGSRSTGILTKEEDRATLLWGALCDIFPAEQLRLESCLLYLRSKDAAAAFKNNKRLRKALEELHHRSQTEGTSTGNTQK
ncbi:hypothetical protein PINS_up004965 [Pythium insidiosum]|nr:hypothetical protein PINS_up004965 [Pythium insidiosum]